MVDLTDFQLFVDQGLDAGNTPIAIWLTRPSYYPDRIREARLSRACLAPKELPPRWASMSRHELESQYIRIGHFYDKLDNDYVVPAETHPEYMDYISWCYNVAHGWTDYVPLDRGIDPAARREYKRMEEFSRQCGLPMVNGEQYGELIGDERTVYVDTPTRSLKAYIGDILELPTGFWMILGCGFAKVPILNSVRIHG